MRINESKLRRIIRQELKESFLKNILDRKKWKQLGKSVKHSAIKHGLSDEKLGENLNFEGYLKYIFVDEVEHYASKLEKLRQQIMSNQISGEQLMQSLQDISIDALCEYTGVIEASIYRNSNAKKYFAQLMDISVRQLASSCKYFAEGGFSSVLRNKKVNLEISFDNIVKTFVNIDLY